MNSVLFVCTGNYYRSRMAEEIFNYWSRHYELGWEAGSAGLRSDMLSSPNKGTISHHAVEMLEKGGYPVTSIERWPKSATKEDLRQHDLIICLNRSEHEPMMKKCFPSFAGDTMYWEVADVEELNPEIAFQLIVFEVGRLVFFMNEPPKVKDRNYPI